MCTILKAWITYLGFLFVFLLILITSPLFSDEHSALHTISKIKKTKEPNIMINVPTYNLLNMNLSVIMSAGCRADLWIFLFT